MSKNKEIVEILITKTKIDPSLDNNIAIFTFSGYKDPKMVIRLLSNKRVNPSRNILYNTDSFFMANKYGYLEETYGFKILKY